MFFFSRCMMNKSRFIFSCLHWLLGNVLSAFRFFSYSIMCQWFTLCWNESRQFNVFKINRIIWTENKSQFVFPMEFQSYRNGSLWCSEMLVKTWNNSTSVVIDRSADSVGRSVGYSRNYIQSHNHNFSFILSHRIALIVWMMLIDAIGAKGKYLIISN